MKKKRLIPPFFVILGVFIILSLILRIFVSSEDLDIISHTPYQVPEKALKGCGVSCSFLPLDIASTKVTYLGNETYICSCYGRNQELVGTYNIPLLSE